MLASIDWSDLIASTERLVTAVLILLTYVKTNSTHKIVNSQMDAYKHDLNRSKDAAIVAASDAGELKGRKDANANNAAIVQADKAGESA